MNRTNHRLIPGLLGVTLLLGSTGLVLAQSAPTAAPTPAPTSVQTEVPGSDPAQTSEIKGKLAHYSLTPRGDVDGLILADGTEVRLPKHASSQLVFSVRPGDTVTIRGLKKGSNPTVIATTVSNDATGTIVNTGPHSPPQQLEDESRVKFQLHDPEGHLNGVLLENGTIIRLPPPDAERNAASLAVGQPLYARGEGLSSPLGKVVAAREIGPNRTALTKVDESRFARWWHDVFGDSDNDAPALPKTP